MALWLLRTTMFLFVSIAFLLATSVDALSSLNSPAPANSQSVYLEQSEARYDLDQACYLSAEFWKRVEDHVPFFYQDARLERFRGFCNNLKKEPPGAEVTLPNGQQLLRQYIFPGIGVEDGVQRMAYPVDTSAELTQTQDRLATKVQKIAQRELQSLLAHKPLVNDDDSFYGLEENDGDTWQRAAWYGWQFLSLRGAVAYMPKTVAALTSVIQPAHRFVGVARQKASCIGTEHSDGRNYMLSTLTPLQCPEGEGVCGIVVDGQTAQIRTNGEPIILDNTFPHHVFNNGEIDRYCLMSEVYHPELSRTERSAVATLFALKDQFTVLDLGLAPWGYDDTSLEFALTSGAVHDIDFWREIGYDRHLSHKIEGKPEGLLLESNKKNKRQRREKSKGAAGGFGQP